MLFGVSEQAVDRGLVYATFGLLAILAVGSVIATIEERRLKREEAAAEEEAGRHVATDEVIQGDFRTRTTRRMKSL